MKKKVWSLLGGLVLAVALGCGTPENTVVIPENPEPLPPGGVKLQVGDGANDARTLDVTDGAPGQR